MKVTLFDFEDWLEELLKVEPQANEKDIDSLLHEYLHSKNRKDIDRYIGSLKSLQAGRVYEELTDQLVKMGVKPKASKKTFNVDILERYRRIPLHAIFLYTTEDQNIASYISENWGALDTLSGDLCDIHPTVDQFKNAEDAYDFIEKLNVVRESNFNAYSQLPGLFFWDNHGATEYVAFGSKPNQDDIKRVVRVVFEEIHKSPTILSISQAKKFLRKENQSGMKEEPKQKHGRLSDLLLILLAFVVVIAGTIVASHFVSPLVLGIAFIAALLFLFLIIWFLLSPSELSQENFMKGINRFFDALPLLRGRADSEKNTEDNNSASK